MLHKTCLVLTVSALLMISQSLSQHSAADSLNSMINQLVQSGDVQSLTYCRISTRDIMATAQSTANRVLQGVCNPRELNDRFAKLEQQVVEQFNVLKTMVLNIEDQLRNQDKHIKSHQARLRQALRAVRADKPSGAVEDEDFTDDPDDYTPEQSNEEYTEGYHHQGEVHSPRQAEIYRYNSTMHDEDGWRVFTYYWQVDDIHYKMTNWGWRRSLRSQSFYVFQGGYRMYMRLYPNQRGENVYIHVSLTKGDYDANLEWPFRLKHKVNVLDHGFPAEDLTSRIWDPTQLCSGLHWRRPNTGDNYECVGLGFEQTLVRSRNYIHDDSIVIKLTVFLV